jgi:type VI secretion system protein ImpK
MNASVETKTHFQSRWSDIIEPKFVTEESAFNFLIPKTTTFYRSRAFVSQIGINPLIAASAPLFFLIETIQALDTAPDIKKLHSDLVHEINAFEHQAGMKGYRPYVVLAARYALCSWIDQIVLNTSWGDQQNKLWEKLRLTDAKESEQESPFFLLINRCLQEPSIYIDLLELFYLCLSLGFMGNKIALDTNKTKIAETRDYLFEIISRQREGYSKRLEIGSTTEDTPKPTSIKPWVRLGVAMLAITILAASYISLNKSLETPISGISSTTAVS